FHRWPVIRRLQHVEVKIAVPRAPVRVPAKEVHRAGTTQHDGPRRRVHTPRTPTIFDLALNDPDELEIAHPAGAEGRSGRICRHAASGRQRQFQWYHVTLREG